MVAKGQGDRAYSAGRYEEAARAYGDAAKTTKRPHDRAEALYLEGSAYARAHTWDKARETFRELDHRAVAVAEHRRVRAAIELGADGVVKLGDAVAERGHPQRRDRVEVTMAIDVDHLVTIGAQLSC